MSICILNPLDYRVCCWWAPFSHRISKTSSKSSIPRCNSWWWKNILIPFFLDSWRESASMWLYESRPKQWTRQTIFYYFCVVLLFFFVLFMHLKSAEVCQVFTRTAHSSLCSRRLSYTWLVQSCPNRKVKLTHTRKHSLAHPIPWQPRQTPNQSSWRLRQNCRFWSHRHSFRAIFTHRHGARLPMSLVMAPGRRLKARSRCYK